MTQVTISTDTAEEMKAILALVRSNKLKFTAVAIKEDKVSSKKAKNVIEEDWTQAGRPMTDAEMDQYLDSLLNQKGGITTDQLTKRQEEWRKKKSFGK